MQLLEDYYSNYDEEGRLETTPHGRIEFATTMHYVERYLTPGARVLEVGAGTGRYSCSIAEKGYQVDALELTSHNIRIFKEKVNPAWNINIHQGNALDLSIFTDNTFDITLVLGPMYHLYTEQDKHQAISEALRVTKPGGVLFVAYVISDAAILEDDFMRNRWDITEKMTEGKIDPITFATSSDPEDIFELVRKEDIDQLMTAFNVERLHYVATEGISRMLRESLETMSEERFALYQRYHLAICERPDMVGMTAHSLDIFQKLG